VTGWLVLSTGKKDPSTTWLIPSTEEDPACLKTGFFRQVRELKIQRKNPGGALRLWKFSGVFIYFSHFEECSLIVTMKYEIIFFGENFMGSGFKV
jgi:hypothetical protein